MAGGGVRSIRPAINTLTEFGQIERGVSHSVRTRTEVTFEWRKKWFFVAVDGNSPIATRPYQETCAAVVTNKANARDLMKSMLAASHFFLVRANLPKSQYGSWPQKSMFAETYFFIIKSLQRTWPRPDSAKNKGNLPKSQSGFLKTPLKQWKMHFLPYFGMFSENRYENSNISHRLSENRPKCGKKGLLPCFRGVFRKPYEIFGRLPIFLAESGQGHVRCSDLMIKTYVSANILFCGHDPYWNLGDYL